MANSANRKRPVVLVIDDDPTMQLMAEEALDAAGFECREAEDGTTGLKIFERSRPDLVLLDVVMPGLDGFQTCAQLRALPGGADVPVMMMTGSDDIDSINAAFEAGATDFVTKPINYQILGHRLRYMFRARGNVEDLRVSKRRLTTAQRVAKLGHWEWDFVTGEVDISDESLWILGLRSADLNGTLSGLLTSVHPDDRERVYDSFDRFIRERQPLRVEHKALRGDKEVIIYQEAEVASDEVTGRMRLIGTFQDITSRKEVEQRIAHLEYYDTLTNLPNRSFFEEHLKTTLQFVTPNNLCAVLAIEIDQVRRLNETLGHSFAQELITNVSDRLVGCTHQSDGRRRKRLAANANASRTILARDASSNNFLLMIPHLSKTDEAIPAARDIMDALCKPLSVRGRDTFVSAAIGISVAPADGVDPEVLTRNACTACQNIRSTGGSSFQFYTESMNSGALERVTLENALRKAVEAGNFHIHYQPKVRCDSELATGMEALIRWEDPDLGRVGPHKFIPVAEEHGLIVRIGEWVLKAACAQAKRWQQEGMPPLTMSVNVASQQMEQEGFVETVRRALEETGLEPQYLELEITESTLMSDVESSIAQLREIQELGVKVSLDDFGTGYSSLSYLNKFPIDTLKIDRSFILEVTTNEDQATLVSALIALAKKLRLQVVAEGIEDEDQFEFLKGHNCDLIQGYLFSPPLPPEAFAQWIREKNQDNYLLAG